MAARQTRASGEIPRGHASVGGTLSTPTLQFDLTEQIELLRREKSLEQPTGRSSRTLVNYEDLRIVLIVMKANTKMHEHQTVARFSVQTIRGHVRLDLPGRTLDLPAGSLAAIDQCIGHDVEALEDSVLLLTISWPHDAEIEKCKGPRPQA